MHAPLAKLSSRLRGERRRAQGEYIYLCPAHDDHNPSLSVTERSDGVLLVTCRAGCSIGDVLGALDLQLKDLYPVRTGIDRGEWKQKLSLTHIADGLDRESRVVAVIISDFINRRSLSKKDWYRLTQAQQRISYIRSIL